jgi:hypothetical protein
MESLTEAKRDDLLIHQLDRSIAVQKNSKQLDMVGLIETKKFRFRTFAQIHS